MNLKIKHLTRLSGLLSLLICVGFEVFSQSSVYQKAYPKFIVKTTQNEIVWLDSTRMKFDDGKTKTFEEKLNDADLEDQLNQKYQKEFPKNSITKNHDPGRARNEAFFRKMYGSTEGEVKKNLVEILWLKNTSKIPILVSKINDVAKRFEAISDEFEQHPELLKYVNNPAGTFKWRPIAGTNRLSTHSFGTSIDINLNFSNYWQWDCKCKNEDQNLAYRNKIVKEVVDIFEKHDFIWGGKWYHYDTMHFEYRPELFFGR